MTEILPSDNRILNFMRHPAILLVLGVATWVLSSIFAQFLTQAIPVGLHGKNDPLGLVVAVIVTSCVVGGYWYFVRIIEGRRVTELAGAGAFPELATGAGIGAFLFGSVMMVIAALGHYQILGANGPEVLIPVLGMALTSGFGEEILLRGLFFRLLEKWLGSWTALALSAALFGALHLGNPNATPIAAFAITIEAGVMLAALYMITRRLWAVIGLHFSWNFVQGGVFGLPVSGFGSAGLIQAKVTGPLLISGGAFGVEASLPAMVIATSAGIAMLIHAHRTGKFMPPSWRGVS